MHFAFYSAHQQHSSQMMVRSAFIIVLWSEETFFLLQSLKFGLLLCYYTNLHLSLWLGWSMFLYNSSCSASCGVANKLFDIQHCNRMRDYIPCRWTSSCALILEADAIKIDTFDAYIKIDTSTFPSGWNTLGWHTFPSWWWIWLLYAFYPSIYKGCASSSSQPPSSCHRFEALQYVDHQKRVNSLSPCLVECHRISPCWTISFVQNSRQRMHKAGRLLLPSRIPCTATDWYESLWEDLKDKSKFFVRRVPTFNILLI